MSKSYRLVVFDWEGTLGDPLGQFLNALMTQAKRLHLGEVNECLARQYLLQGLLVAIKKLFPHLSTENQEGLLKAVQDSMASRSLDTHLIPGAKTLVQRIKQAGMDLAIATNKGQHSLKRVLQAVGFDVLFTVTRSAGQAPAKPCPKMLEEIMTICGVRADQTLMIGDSVSDVEMASSVGVDVVGVNFYNQPEQLAELLVAGALEVFDDYHQLANYLQL